MKINLKSDFPVFLLTNLGIVWGKLSTEGIKFRNSLSFVKALYCVELYEKNFFYCKMRFWIISFRICSKILEIQKIYLQAL